MASVKVANTVTRNGWTIDAEAIGSALELLGVDCSVQVKLMNGRVTLGNTGKYAHGYVIGVSRYLSAEDATKTLWHELTHAMQCETGHAGEWNRFIESYRRYSSIAGGSQRYLDNPYEREARDIASMYADVPLTEGGTYA